MVDQSHNEKLKIEAMIQTIVNIQTAYAKALCIDRQTLATAQAEGDIVGAENVLIQAFNADVTPLVASVLEESCLAPDPLAAYRGSGYQKKIEAERGGRKTKSGGLG